MFVVDQCCRCCFLVDDDGIVGVIISAVVGVLVTVDVDEDDNVECVGTVVVSAFVCFFVVVVGVVLVNYRICR